MSGLLHDKYDNQIKRKLHKFRFRKIKTWQIFLILIPLLFLSATLLRIDHLKMVELRDAVLAADEEGNEEQLITALESLRNFTFGHIVVNVIDDNGNQKLGLGTGPFYLEQSYRRAAEKALAAAEEKLSSDENPNGNIYAEAANVCKPAAIANGWNWTSPGYISCMTSEIEKYAASDNLVDQIVADLPSTELYRVEYSSPIWTPTLSGFIILIILILIVVIFIRFLIWLILNLSLLFL